MTKPSTGPRKQQLEQALQVLGWLSEPGEGYTKERLAERLGVHPRTVSRLITALGSAGFIIHDDMHGSRKHFRVESAIGHAFISPTSQELAALTLVVETLRRDHSPHADSLASINGKMNLVMRERAKRALAPDLDQLNRRQRIAPRPGPVGDRDADTVELIQEAIKAGCCIELDYRTGPDQPARRRLLEPWGLLLGPISHLLARPAGTQGKLLTFRVDRMRSVCLSPDLALVPEGWTLDEHLAGSVGVFHGDAHDITLRVRAQGVAKARHWRFHAGQQVEEDGEELLIRFHAGGLRELAEHLFTWGDEIRIEGPEALREEMRERLALAQRAI